MDACTAYDNNGHAVLAGNPSESGNRVVRVTMRNVEFGRNAEAAGVRLSADQVHMIGGDIIIEGCGFSGLNKAGDTAASNAIYIAGKNIHLRDNRYLDLFSRAVLVDQIAWFTSNGVFFEGVAAVNGTPLDPAIQVAAGVDNVYAFTGNDAAMNALISPNLSSVLATIKVIRKVADETRSATTTLANDAALKLAIPFEKQRVTFRCVLIYAGPAAADIKIAFTGPAGSIIRWGTASGVRVTSDDSIVQSDAIVAFGTAMVLGTGTPRRCIELVGEVITNGTAGDLTLQWAQATSDAGNTTVYGESHIVAEM
jgi:hypothetical protein